MRGRIVHDWVAKEEERDDWCSLRGRSRAEGAKLEAAYLAAASGMSARQAIAFWEAFDDPAGRRPEGEGCGHSGNDQDRDDATDREYRDQRGK